MIVDALVVSPHDDIARDAVSAFAHSLGNALYGLLGRPQPEVEQRHLISLLVSLLYQTEIGAGGECRLDGLHIPCNAESLAIHCRMLSSFLRRSAH